MMKLYFVFSLRFKVWQPALFTARYILLWQQN